MAKRIEVQYAIIYGKNDCSDWIPYEIKLTPEEEKVFEQAIQEKTDLRDVYALTSVIERASTEIEEEIISNAVNNANIDEDDYVLECQGLTRMDPDEINDLVAERDPYTLDFFDLNDMDDEDLEEWDANDYDMPFVKDFDPDFEPSSPFDAGWELQVEFKDPDEYWEED